MALIIGKAAETIGGVLVLPAWLREHIPGDDAMIWRKYTVTYTDVAAAASSGDAVVATLRTREVLEHVVVKHSETFDGGSLSAYSVTLGVDGDAARYIDAHSVGHGVAVADDAAVMSEGPWLESFANETEIKIYATATGGNTDDCTQGSLDVWLHTSRLPE